MKLIDALFTRPPHTPIPRGLARSGPAVLSYGFRPFFLAAGIWGLAAMGLWIGALVFAWPLGGHFGAAAWHAHEMLFGYASAALAGFMLTAIPNWTGRLPVSGGPLLMLVCTWLAGRVAMLAIGVLGGTVAAVLDLLFLPVLALVAGREIVAGRNWKNLKILIGLVALSAANLGFHLAGAEFHGHALRMAIAAYVMLIGLVGGRIVPSFTRNWLARRDGTVLPTPFDRFDQVTLGASVVALAVWVVWPLGLVPAGLALLAAGLQAVRLWRWRGWQTWPEPLVWILHAAYGFVPLGLLAVAAGAVGAVGLASAVHVLTVGAIGTMTLAIMSRASLGHTGRPLTASPMLTAAYLSLVFSGLCRPLADALPGFYLDLLALSGGLWMAGFLLFVIEYTPILLKPRLAPRRG